MPKSIVIEPQKVFRKGAIHLPEIPVNAYQRTAEEERADFSREKFLPFQGHHPQTNQSLGELERRARLGV